MNVVGRQGKKCDPQGNGAMNENWNSNDKETEPFIASMTAIRWNTGAWKLQLKKNAPHGGSKIRNLAKVPLLCFWGSRGRPKFFLYEDKWRI